MSGLLRDPSERQRKLTLLREPHVRALNALVDEWRSRWPARAIPWFDPDDGGTGASTLLLMEAPGPRTAAAGDAGFCSEDNDDPTAAVFRGEREISGLRRSDYVKWNIVPWQLTDDNGAWRAPRPVDLEQVAEPLTQLLECLSNLQLVVTVGRSALHGWTRHQTLFADRIVPLLAVPHPSLRNASGRAESITRLRYALQRAAEVGKLPA